MQAASVDPVLSGRVLNRRILEMGRSGPQPPDDEVREQREDSVQQQGVAHAEQADRKPSEQAAEREPAAHREHVETGGLSEQPRINFNAGDHAISIQLSHADFLKAETPREAGLT